MSTHPPPSFPLSPLGKNIPTPYMHNWESEFWGTIWKSFIFFHKPEMFVSGPALALFSLLYNYYFIIIIYMMKCSNEQINLMIWETSLFVFFIGRSRNYLDLWLRLLNESHFHLITVDNLARYLSKGAIRDAAAQDVFDSPSVKSAHDWGRGMWWRAGHVVEGGTCGRGRGML